MRAMICDVCETVTDEDVKTTFEKYVDKAGKIRIDLDDQTDWCADCARKAFAKLARSAWNDTKRQRIASA